MDRRRAAGALLALAVCITSSDAAPTASNQTTLDLYDGAAEGCYYNFQHYGEGDRIMTNEPCLNCTCHNRMLMCYLRVCPFTKPIGQDCTVEKRADQCCPIITCPDVPVDLLTSTSTTSPAEYGATGVGKLDKYGCNINGKYFPEGSKVPPNPNNSCEHCYCIRNMTTCVMQECTLHVDGCTPIYHKAVCCPVRYSCDHPEDEMLLLDDMTTTVRPTPGFLLTTTTLSPVTQMSQDCVHEDRIVTDGALIKTEKACEHCYCMKGDIVCVVQECGTPMENEGKNCTSQPPREGQCCPDTYICEGDEIATELPSGITIEPTISEEITTLSPPRRIGVEGSGYRKESEESYTEVTPFETDTEGSGYDHEIGPIIDTSDTDEKQTPEITSDTTEDILYITTSAKTPSLEEIEKTTEPDKGLNTVPSGLFDEESHETSMTQRTTLSEEIHLTEPTIITEDKKDALEDTTIVPEITSSEMIDKHDEILTTTVPTIITEDKKDEFEDKTIIPEITLSEMIDKHDEILTTTGPTIITEDKKDEFEDKTIAPEITASVTIDKHDEILTTTEPTVRIEDENNEVTDLAGHTEGDKISTTQKQPTEASTPQSEHDISEIETKAPSIDESEVKVTTEVYTTKYEFPVDKGTSKQPFDEITSAETIKPSDEVTIEETEKYDKATTPSVFEASEKDTTKSDVSTEDIVKQKETTTGSLLEVITSSSKPYSNEEVDTMEENIVTTQSSLTLSTSTKAIAPTVEVSEDVTFKEEKEITTVLPLEVSTQAEFAGPSDDDNIDKITKEKETATEPSLETLTSTEGTKLLAEVTSSSTMQQKESTTEPALETSSHALATDTPDETGDEHAIKDKDITTESSLLSSISDKVTESLELPTTSEIGGMDEVISTTEKTSILETTSIDNKENEVEDFARIPGEGDCLVNSVTYRNNSDVPSTNNCHTSCRCVSSIVKCDPIICSPPPEYMDNCQPIYDSPDSCYPTYICHSGETMPPQPDSHMSGTEKPVTSSTLECNGDQCMIKQDEKSPAPSAKPAVSECGPTGCGDDTQGYPHVPDIDKISTDCDGDECLPSTEVCTNGNCQGALPVKPCEGEKCDKPAVSECGPTGCGDDAQGYPHVPDTDKISTDCVGNECLPSTEVCTNGNCQGALPVKPCEGEKCDKPAVSECGPTGCGDDAQGYPHVPDTDKISTDCVGNECLPSTEVCTNGNCQEALPVKPCEGEKCDKPAVSACGPTGCGDDAQGYPHVPDTDKISTDCVGNECLPSTEVCTNGNCQGALPVKPCEGEKCDKPAVSECGPTGCGDDAQGYPHVPDTDKISTDCVGNECLPSTEVCTNGNCQGALPVKPCEGEKCDKPAVSECGPTGCGDDVQGYPHVPDTDKISTECDGNECLPSTEVCTNGNCQGALPAKPCEGEKCDIEPVIIPVKNIPLCENENDCKPQVVPCEGNECVQVDCNTSDCGTTAVSPSIENEQKPEACTDKDNCQKQEDEPKLPCSDDSCRRKETEVLDNQLPIDCSGSDCEKQKPDVVEKVDIQTEMPIKVPEIVTETIPEEPSSKYPKPAEESPVEKYGETPSSETHSTTIIESSEQSTPKSDLVDEPFSFDTSTMPETLESSITTESSLATESGKIMHSEPTPQSVDITASVYTSVTESQLSKETTQTEEEFMKPTVASPEISDQTSEYPKEQTSSKPSDEPIAVDEAMVTDKPIATQLPEASEIPTELQKTSVTESEPTTVSRLDVEAGTLGETTPEASTEGPSITTKVTDKKILELPEYPTTEPQHDIRTTEATTPYKTEEGTIKMQEEEKETVTAATIQESDKSTTKTDVPIAETSDSSTQSQETDKQQETQTSAYEPSDESSSAIPHDTIDVTTTEFPQRIDTDKTESNEIAEKTTPIPEKPKITESEYEIRPTEATKVDQSTAHEDIESTSKPELPDILSMTPAIQEEENKTPFTNKPSVPYEDKTMVPDMPVTEENIVTLKPEIDTTEKQKEPEASDIPVTISYETVTASKEVSTAKQDDMETKSDSLVTDEPVKKTETTKSEVADEVATESSITKQDVQTESSPAAPTTSAAEKTSNISQALSTESDIEFTKSPKEDQVTDMPVQSSSTYESNKEETSEKETVSEIPEKYTTLIDKIGTEKPLSETTEFEPSVTESSTSKLIKESTEPQITFIPEEVKPTDQTDELPQATDKIKEEEDIPTERPGLSQQEETFTSTQMPEEPFKTTSVPKLTQESATELDQQDSQITTTEYHQEKEGTTEPSVQTYTEPQEVKDKTPSINIVTPSSEEPVTEIQSSKEPVDYSVTESELSTGTPGQFVTKEKETTVSEKRFTTEGSELLHITKSDEHFTKLYPEEELLTEIPVIVTEQQKDTETTDTSELGPKIKEQETKEPGPTTIAPLVTDAESKLTQPAVTSYETGKGSTESSVTESAVSLSTNIPESHIKDEEQTLTVTTFTNVPTNALEEEQSQTPHPTVSELQTEELLEVTEKPQSLFTEEPQAITTLSVPETTEDIHKEIITDSLIEATTASIEEASQLPQDKVTEKTDEMLTRAPQDMATEVPQVEITTKWTDDISVELQTETETAVKETSTEKLQEPSVTDTMIDIEKSTLKSDEPVTETSQDLITKATQETAEEELKTTHSPIDLTTKSEILREGDVTKESETSATPIPQEKITVAAGETISEVQPTVTTTIPETIDTKHDETSETLPGLSTSLPEEMITVNVPDSEASTKTAETSTKLPDYEITKPEVKETSKPKYEVTETTPYVVELEEHTHKAVEETSTMVSDDSEAITKPTESHVEISTEKESTTVEVEPTEHEKDQSTANVPFDDVSKLSDEVSEKSTPSLSPTDEITTQSTVAAEIPAEKQDEIPSIHTKPHDDVSSTSERETEISLQTEKTPSTDLSPEITMPEEEILPATSKATTIKIEEDITTSSPVFKPEAKPSETLPPTATPETPKPGLNEVLPTDEMPEDDGHFPPSGGSSGYGQEPDYVEEDQAFGPGTCRYGGKVYVSAQQIPRDDPCDFCFCFRSDIICLQQSCPPPIHGCHEEPIQGFCCPRYECPVAMATSLNVTTTTTTTTTTLPPHFLPHAYKGAAQRRGCQIKGHTYKVGEVVRASSGPCLHCTCGGDGQMKCDPKACTPEPMLRQMIAAAVSAKRRR